MTKEETGLILLRLNEAFHREPGPGELAMWAEQIRRFDYDVALEATRRIVRASDRFPTVSRFYEEGMAVLRRRAMDQPSLPEPWPSREVAKAGLARAREALAGAVWRADNWRSA